MESMKFSHSLNKNIFETSVGALVNKFYLNKRRDVLFFGDIITRYVKLCEIYGYGNELKEIYQHWTYLVLKELVPDILKKLPPVLFLNTVMKKVWINLGILDDLVCKKKGDKLILKTLNEGITRDIGENSIIPGLYIGVFNTLFEREVKLLFKFQTKERNVFNKYIFLIENKKSKRYKTKGRRVYFKLNSSLQKQNGVNLFHAIKKGVFTLSENKIYFRGKPLIFSENTIFHLLGHKRILIEKIPEISYEFFKKIIRESKDKEKLILLKTLIQSMGWGNVTIILENEKIIIWVRNPPFGLQYEPENWNFLIQTILGFLWLINKNTSIKEIKFRKKSFYVIYSKSQNAKNIKEIPSHECANSGLFL